MLTKDSHNPDLQVQQKTQTTTIRDFTGGLNLSDPPLLLKENQLLEATNWQYSPEGEGFETRDILLPSGMAGYSIIDEVGVYNPEGLNIRGTLLQPIDGVIFVVVDKKLYSFPSLLKPYPYGDLRCSDFTWMRLGPWSCLLMEMRSREGSCDLFSGPYTLGDLPYLYDFKFYRMAYIGDISGDLEPIAAMWGDANPEMLIASGGKLQKWSHGNILETMEDSPDCTYVTKAAGRALVNSLEHSSRLVLSGVGDPSNWRDAATCDDWTEADSIWIDVGYKSGGGISSIATLSKDLIIWKTNGTVYRLTGAYPDWAVYEIGRNVWNMNPYCPVEAGGDLYFPDLFYGFSSIQTVIQYGEMRAGTVGYEVNKAVISEIDSEARMWSVPSRNEIWIKPRRGSRHVYAYNIHHRAWTKFVFPLEVMGIVSVGSLAYLSLAGSGGLGSRTATYLLGDHVKYAMSILKSDPLSPPDIYSDTLFTGNVDYQDEATMIVGQTPIRASIKLPPLYAFGGQNLLKHLVVDLWGPPLPPDPGEGDPGEDDNTPQEKFCNMDTYMIIETWDLAAKTFTNSLDGETYTYDDDTKFYLVDAPATAEEFFTALSVMGRGVAIRYNDMTKYTCGLQTAVF